MSTGRFIVIDGLDGSGKATQAGLLASRLNAEKIDFPRYGVQMFGALIGECLAGQHGDFLHMDPKIASTLYALDRFEAAPLMREWLAVGKTIVADRYTSSNQIHQGGKIMDAAVRAEFLSWLDRLEHEVLNLPRPDLIVYLHVPIEVTAELLTKKRLAKNEVLKGESHDMVEKDKQYALGSYESAQALAASQPNWHVIECAKDGVLRTPEDIHEEILSLVTA